MLSRMKNTDVDNDGCCSVEFIKRMVGGEWNNQ